MATDDWRALETDGYFADRERTPDDHDPIDAYCDALRATPPNVVTLFESPEDCWASVGWASDAIMEGSVLTHTSHDYDSVDEALADLAIRYPQAELRLP